MIGVKMGEAAIRKLNTDQKKNLCVKLKIPLKTPYSCIIDGVQTITQCTIGNRKLKIENTNKTMITGYFENKNSNEKVIINVNPRVIKILMEEMAPPNFSEKEMEELAWKILAKTEEELFNFSPSGKEQ